MDFLYGDDSYLQALDGSRPAALEYLLTSLDTSDREKAMRFVREWPGFGGFSGWITLIDKDKGFPSLEKASQGSIEESRKIALLFIRKDKFCAYPCFKSAQFFIELAINYEDRVEMSKHYEFYTDCQNAIYDVLKHTKKWWLKDNEDQRLALYRILAYIEEELAPRDSSIRPSLAAMLSHENRPYTDYEESIQLYSQHIEVCEPKNLTELIDLLDCQAKLAECCIKKTTPNYPLAQECCIKMGTGLEKAFLDVVEITNEEELLHGLLRSRLSYTKGAHNSLCVEVFLLGPKRTIDLAAFKSWATNLPRVAHKQLIERYGETFLQDILSDRRDRWIIPNHEFTYDDKLATFILRTEHLGRYWKGLEKEFTLKPEQIALSIDPTDDAATKHLTFEKVFNAVGQGSELRYELALMLITGHGCKRDIKRAVKELVDIANEDSSLDLFYEETLYLLAFLENNRLLTSPLGFDIQNKLKDYLKEYDWHFGRFSEHRSIDDYLSLEGSESQKVTLENGKLILTKPIKANC